MRLPETLLASLPEEIAAACDVDITDARRIFSLVQRTGRLPDKAPATVRRIALDRVKELAPELFALEALERHESKIDPFVKYVFAGARGRPFETVRIPLEKQGRFSVCVSSQVGCALACSFCATGTMGLIGNLEAWEIVEQVRSVRRELPEGSRVHGVVFQGMGEPLSNYDRVKRAIRVLGDPSGLAIDRRNITVCTSGLPSAIRRLAAELPSVRLGISIGDARPGHRRALMPIDDKHPLDEVLEAAGEHAARSGSSPMWAYTLLAGVNDDADAARALAERARAFQERWGHRPRISVIAYNEVASAPFRRSSDEATRAFRDTLSERGVGSIRRYSGGSDVKAACGQLVRLPVLSHPKL